MNATENTPDYAARLERLAKARAAEHVEEDWLVRSVLSGEAHCGRYLMRSRTEYDGACRLELADKLEQAQRLMAHGVMSSPSWWPTSTVLDLDTGEEMWVDVSVQVCVSAPRPSRRRTRARS